MSFVSLSSNILILKKNWYAYNNREFNKNYLFLMILFNIKFTIKFSLSLSLSLSLSQYKYIYIYIYIFFFNWLRHPIIFNIFHSTSVNHFHQVLSLFKTSKDLESCSLRIMDYIIFMMQIA